MSSNTRVELTPPPVEVTVRGRHTVGVMKFLGRGGCRLIRDTVEDVLDPNQADEAKCRWRQEWSPVRAAPDDYVLTLPRHHLPAEVTRQVEAVSAHLRLGASVADTSFDLNFIADRNVGAEEEERIRAAVQKALVRPVNQLLALCVRERVSEQLRQRVENDRVRQTVQNRLANAQTFTLRTYAYAKA